MLFCYFDLFLCFMKIEWVISCINTIIKMRIIHSFLKSLNSSEIHNRGLNEESRETEDSMRNRAYINAKKKQDANRIKKIDGSFVLRRDKKTKRKEKCEWKTVRRKNAKLVSLARPQNGSWTNDSSFGKEPLIIHKVTPITITHRLVG